MYMEKYPGHLEWTIDLGVKKTTLTQNKVCPETVV